MQNCKIKANKLAFSVKPHSTSALDCLLTVLIYSLKNRNIPKPLSLSHTHTHTHTHTHALSNKVVNADIHTLELFCCGQLSRTFWEAL